MLSTKYLLNVAVALLATSACSTSERNASHNVACTNNPQVAWDYSKSVADRGSDTETAVQVPELAVDQAFLYYLLSYTIVPVQHGPMPTPPSVPPVPQAAGWTLTLGRVPLNGDAPEQIVLQPGVAPARAIIAVGDAAYVAEPPSVEGGDGSVVRVSNDASTPEPLVKSVGLVESVASDGKAIYFSDDEGIKRVGLVGGKSKQLSSLTPASSLIFSGDALYASVVERGIFKLDSESGAETLFDPDPAARELTECASAVCWLSGTAFDSHLVRRTPSGDRRVIAEGLNEPHALTVDNRNAFVTIGGFGIALLRVPLEGGSATTIPDSGGTDLASNRDCIYWSTVDSIYGRSLVSADEVSGEE